ncbi:MAG: nucleoside monophosphate kinase [bacterium]|nr:nucleoside monophosphate kinase [bacterium]
MTPSKVIIILGPPGSGKGTQAQLLTERIGFFLWETSSIVGGVIERAKSGDFVKIEGKKYLFSDQAKIRRQGLLWDGSFVFYFSKKKFEELAKDGKSIVVSGSPREIEEAKRLLPLLKKLYGAKNITMLALKLTPGATIWRNSHRRECELATHSILYTKETKSLTRCPLDGSRLMRRKDDDPKAIKMRLERYKEKTSLVFDFFRNQGIKVKEINGEQSVADVFKDILKALK